jgi:hypothetical protein
MVLTMPEPARPRSRSVTSALVLTLLSAVICAALAVMFVLDYVNYAGVAARSGVLAGASQSRVLEDIETQHLIDGVCAGAFGLMAVVLLAVGFLARRSSGGRVVACVLGVVQALCCGGMVAYLSLGISLLDVSSDDPYLDVAFKVQYDAQPVWAKALIPTSTFALPILGIMALILWLVPSSNRYYRALRNPEPQPLPFVATPGFAPQPPPGYGYPPQQPYAQPQYPQPQYPQAQYQAPPPGYPPSYPPPPQDYPPPL